jgi:VanZ like family
MIHSLCTQRRDGRHPYAVCLRAFKLRLFPLATDAVPPPGLMLWRMWLTRHMMAALFPCFNEVHHRARGPRDLNTPRHWGLVVALAAAGLIAIATLTPSGDAGVEPWCVPCALRHRGLVGDVIANLVLFAPLGFGLGLAGVRPRIVLLGSLATSLCVESLQAYVIAGRVANVVDVVTNTTGAALGAAMAPRWRLVICPPRKASRWLAAAARCQPLNPRSRRLPAHPPDSYPNDTLCSRCPRPAQCHDR